MTDALFFGCARGIDGRRDVGHYFYEPDGSRLLENRPRIGYEALQPFGMPDGKLAPRPRRYEEYPEGVALLHHKDGWTALAFWDRSGDSRGQSNSNFILRGTLTFDEALAAAKERFPALFERFPFDVVELEAGAPLWQREARRAAR